MLKLAGTASASAQTTTVRNAVETEISRFRAVLNTALFSFYQTGESACCNRRAQLKASGGVVGGFVAGLIKEKLDAAVIHVRSCEETVFSSTEAML